MCSHSGFPFFCQQFLSLLFYAASSSATSWAFLLRLPAAPPIDSFLFNDPVVPGFSRASEQFHLMTQLLDVSSSWALLLICRTPSHFYLAFLWKFCFSKKSKDVSTVLLWVFPPFCFVDVLGSLCSFAFLVRSVAQNRITLWIVVLLLLWCFLAVGKQQNWPFYSYFWMLVICFCHKNHINKSLILCLASSI